MKNNKLERVINAVCSDPWAVRPSYMEIMTEVIDDRLAGIQREFAAAEEKTGTPSISCNVQNGVALIPVKGVIVNRAGIMQRMSGATSPQTIARQFKEAMASASVNAVCFCIDSPGGQVLGVKELSDMIYETKQSNPRPVVAFIEGLGASAAYWIASQCDEIVTTEASIVGSIGVISKVTDTSRMEKNEGLDSYVLRSGRNKAAGVGNITEEQLNIQKEIIQTYFGMFTEAVCRGRNVKALSDSILSGREFLGKQSIQEGLCDRIGTLETILKDYGKKC